MSKSPSNLPAPAFDDPKHHLRIYLGDCLDQCAPPLDAARAACKTQVGCGGSGNACGFNAAYISCLNPAQSAAFACRNICDDAFRLNTTAQAALQA